MNVFIDTNVYLSFYSLGSDDLEQLRKLVTLVHTGGITLYLTEQVRDEFKRNREPKIAESLQKLKAQSSKFQFPMICKGYEDYADLKSHHADFLGKLDSLLQKISEDIKRESLKADVIINDLFGRTVVLERTDEILAKADSRARLGNPPGKPGSLGDAVSWEALLAAPLREDQEDLHLVSGDKDYYSIIEKNEPKKFLVDEWEVATLADIYFYRSLSQFLSKHFPDIKLASEAELEEAVRSLVLSNSFSTTHQAIARLSKYDYLGTTNAESVAEAFIENDQVRWILVDEDVKEYFEMFYEKYWRAIGWQKRRELRRIKKELEKENEALTHEDFEDIPF